MARRRKQAPPPPPDPERVELPAHVLRELVSPDTFRVWFDTSDPDHVGEFVVTIAPDGVRIWESHDWHPSKLNATSDHDPGHPDAHDGFHVDWHELLQIGGRGAELVADIRGEIREIQRELETWVSIRAREAHRIARAREIERQANMRRLLFLADEVLSRWMPPGRKRVTWRDMVKRRRE